MIIRLASGASDITAVQQLCRDFRAYLYESYAAEKALVDVYYDPGTFEDLLSRLPEIHRRPQGAILLALFGGEPVGCVMHHEMAPGIAEMKRLYVAPQARGRGAAEALVRASIDRAKADGYRLMRLDTGFRQVEATRLYRKLGFAEIGPPAGADPLFAAYLRFFERAL